MNDTQPSERPGRLYARDLTADDKVLICRLVTGIPYRQVNTTPAIVIHPPTWNDDNGEEVIWLSRRDGFVRMDLASALGLTPRIDGTWRNDIWVVRSIGTNAASTEREVEGTLTTLAVCGGAVLLMILVAAIAAVALF